MDKINVLLADDHLMVRQGLRAMLATAPDMEVVAEAGDGLEAIEKAKEHRPHVVLMDLRMPNLDGLTATRRIKSQFASMSVIVVTIYDNDAYVVDAIRAGAGGYLLKDASKDLLLHTIRAVNSGGMLIKTSLLRKAMLDLADASGGQSSRKYVRSKARNGLTAREHAVLHLVIQGQTNKEIGGTLCISEDTAKKHVQSILSKLDVSDRTQAAVKAVRAGIVEPFSNEELQ